MNATLSDLVYNSSVASFHLNYFSVASLQTNESVALFSVPKQNSEKAM